MCIYIHGSGTNCTRKFIQFSLEVTDLHLRPEPSRKNLKNDHWRNRSFDCWPLTLSHWSSSTGTSNSTWTPWLLSSNIWTTIHIGTQKMIEQQNPTKVVISDQWLSIFLGLLYTYACTYVCKYICYIYIVFYCFMISLYHIIPYLISLIISDPTILIQDYTYIMYPLVN